MKLYKLTYREYEGSINEMEVFIVAQDIIEAIDHFRSKCESEQITSIIERSNNVLA